MFGGRKDVKVYDYLFFFFICCHVMPLAGVE